MQPNNLFVFHRQRHDRFHDLALFIRFGGDLLGRFIEVRYLLPPPVLELVLADIHSGGCQP